VAQVENKLEINPIQQRLAMSRVMSRNDFVTVTPTTKTQQKH